MPTPKKANVIKRDTRYFFGLDPGKQGGIVVLDSDKNVVAFTEMPPTEKDLWLFLTRFSQCRLGNAALEAVRSMPGEGHKGAFTFGEGFGRLKMALTAAEIPYNLVQPKAWQKEVSIRGRSPKEPKAALKERCRTRAQSLFPVLDVWGGTLKVQRAICDALLLAEYARRQENRS